MNTVIERGLGGPICGECAAVLPVAGDFNRVCLICHPYLEYTPSLLAESEAHILQEAMLLDGKPLAFTFPQPVTSVEVIVEEDIFAKFDRVFGKMWNKVLDKLDKI